MRKTGLILVLIAILTLAAGCGQKPGEGPKAAGDQPAVTSGAQGTTGANQYGATDPNDSKQPPSSSKLTIQAYYTDSDLMELKQVQREITITDDKSKYTEAFKTLQSPDPEGKLVPLWEKITLNSVSYSDEQVNLDITIPDEARLGAGGETFAIDALKKTFFQFKEVKQIELTVDGEKVESLMGHADLEHPITR